MYPKGCISSNTQMIVRVLQDRKVIHTMNSFDINDYTYIYFEKLAKGTYTITVQATWGPNYVKEFTLKAYSPYGVTFNQRTDTKEIVMN